MPQDSPDFTPILAALNEARVRFVLIGGMAMVAHGSAHVTQDVDFAYATDPENARALAVAFAPFHPRLRGVPADLPFILDERTFRNTQNMTLETDAGAVDLLGYVPGVETFDELYERADTIKIFGAPIRVASIDDVIAMKRAANRAKDQMHLLELQELKKLQDEAK